MNEFLATIPWPEFWLIGIPAFVAGFFTGRHGGVRPNRGIR